MVLASDYWHTEFAIGQYHSNLEVWLRRPETDTDDVPGFAVDRVFQSQRSISMEIILQHDDLRIDVGGRTRLTGHLPADSLRMWSPGQIALGDEVYGGGPRQGQISRAQVRIPSRAVDYVRPGALSIPQSYLYLPDHAGPLPPTTRKQWLLAFLDLLSFIPLGFFLIVLSGRPPVRLVPATLLAAALTVVLAAGKLLFHARHTSVAIIVMQAAGGLLGALLTSRLAHARHGIAQL
jgi:hypothetical protein